jgi:hypothetical protein
MLTFRLFSFLCRIKPDGMQVGFNPTCGVSTLVDMFSE